MAPCSDLEDVGAGIATSTTSPLTFSQARRRDNVAGPSVITRLIEMDAELSDEKWRRDQMEADQFIPYPLDEVSPRLSGPGSIDPWPAMGQCDVGSLPAR